MNKIIIETEPVVIESNQNHATITQSGVCPTLSSSMGMGGGYVPMIVVPERSVQKIDEEYICKEKKRQR